MSVILKIAPLVAARNSIVVTVVAEWCAMQHSRQIRGSDLKAHSQPYTALDEIFVSGRFAADCIGVTSQTLRAVEDEIEIRREIRGSVPTRIYSLCDIFAIAALRRKRGLTKGLDRPVTVSTFAPSWGAAKTICAINLAMYASMRGLKTLIIDNDPKAFATSSFGYEPAFDLDELAEHDIPADRGVGGHFGHLLGISAQYPSMSLADVIKKPYGEHGPHLIPAEESLEDLDDILASPRIKYSEFSYAQFIQKALCGQLAHCDLSTYELIIIDNPLTGSFYCTRSSMLASDLLICPIHTDKLSSKKIRRLAEKLGALREEFDSAPDIVAVPTMHIKSHKNLDSLSQLFLGQVTSSLLLSEDYTAAMSTGVPLIGQQKAPAGSIKAMRLVLDEIIERVRAIV